MSKHTYLYPLPASARFLWMLGRASASDLFGYPDDTHRAGWSTTIRLDEELSRARTAVMRIIQDADRVCIGHGYTIPDSVSGEPDYHDTHHSTVYLTGLFWNAPVLTPALARTVLDEVRAPVDDRDPYDTFSAFLAACDGQLIIPVWM